VSGCDGDREVSPTSDRGLQTVRGSRSGVSDFHAPADGESGPLPTGCGPVDDLLGGGLERGTVTQVYGPPAAGKTNLALSAAVRVAADGGVVVYVDTEGLSTDRFHQLAEAVAAEQSPDDGPSGAGEAGFDVGAGGTDARRDTELKADPASGEGVESRREAPAADSEALSALASRIVVTEAHDFDEQAEAVRDVAEFAERADLIVLDSATGFYRLAREAGDEGETLRKLGRQVTHLLSLARKHDLAVLVTNQVFTDPDADRTRALGGHTLDHWCGVVVRLDRFRGGNRRATLEKHRSKPAGETARFRIVDEGLVAAEEP
jgi:DNA repair protein RadB